MIREEKRREENRREEKTKENKIKKEKRREEIVEDMEGKRKGRQIRGRERTKNKRER